MMRTDRQLMPPAKLIRLRYPLLGEAALNTSSALDEIHEHAPGGDLIGPSAGAAGSRLVLSGWVAEARVISDGRRQITVIRLPGDLIDLAACRRLGLNVTGLTRFQTADGSGLAAAIAADPASHACEQAGAQQAHVDQITRLGRLSAYERTSHLLLELHERLLTVGLAGPGSFHMPLTQEVLADVLGLSIVHVNRTMQQLRRDGLISYRSSQVSLLQRERLAGIGGYTLRHSAEAPSGLRLAGQK
jgi:CRP-like cAMP-binding protein